ncbi:mitochondrial import receptor subunit tom20 [Spiromyces aspiralis]|uniref:Mitochondrial import receptor subunit tom20 n=1 Tax=Spiromyces aspiralis TaxID=68401 RepID=A0ACC1HYN6_9FUNG|nr:mitochondrial import receptor subunit tom20 [Spiromyces aspiralis]
MKTSTFVLLTAAGLATAGVGYLAYFDYKRRNDPKFRKKLRRDKRRAAKAAESESKRANAETNQIATRLVKKVSGETMPATPEEKEKFFMGQVSKGEALAAGGPGNYEEAACCFYRALKVYPNPIELVMIYQKTIPDVIFSLVMAMMAQEVKLKQERYYDVFPPKEMNVQIKDKRVEDEKKQDESASDNKHRSDVLLPKLGLFATKDIEAGEVIYEEDAVVSTLLPEEEASKSYCHHCQKPIPVLQTASGDVQALEIAKSEETSKTEGAKEHAETNESNGDEEWTSASAIDPENEEGAKPESAVKDVSEEKKVEVETAEEKEEKEKKEDTVTNPNAFECTSCYKAVYCSESCRTEAYDAYHQLLCAKSPQAASLADSSKESHELAPILIAKFFGTIIDKEKKKELARVMKTGGEAKDDSEYTTWEHLERFKYLEIIPGKSDAVALNKLDSILAAKIPGLSEFVNEDRYVTLKGKLAYNTYATFKEEGAKSAGDADKAVKDTYRNGGEGEPKGLALYLVTAHANHSCEPNAKPTFPADTTKLALVATKLVKKGEELTVSYIPVGHPERPYESRNKELMDKFRLKCGCSKCEAEKV